MTENEYRRSAHLSVEEKERAVTAANQNSAVARIVNIVYFLFGVLELLLAGRLVFQLLGANDGNAVASIILGLTQPFVALFAGLFSNPAIGQGGLLELTTVTAMIFYAVLAWLIGRLLWLVLSRPR
jgi:YggT family protein